MDKLTNDSTPEEILSELEALQAGVRRRQKFCSVLIEEINLSLKDRYEKKKESYHHDFKEDDILIIFINGARFRIEVTCEEE